MVRCSSQGQRGFWDATNRDIRPLVEERRRLLPGRGDVQGRQRRRRGRLPRPDAADRLSRRARRDLPVAHAVLPHPQQGRRLRHHRLLHRRSEARHAGRLRGVHAHRPRPRPTGHRRPRGQPHVRPASVVQGGPVEQGLAAPRLVRLVRHPGTGQPRPGRLPRQGEQRLGVRRGLGPVLPAQLLPAPAGPERGQPRGQGRDRPRAGLLDGAGAVRLPGGRGAVPDRERRSEAGRAARVPGRPAGVHDPADGRIDPARRGERRLQGPGLLLRRRARRPDHDVLRLHRDAEGVAVAGPLRRGAAVGGAARAAEAAQGLPVGRVPA